VLPAMKVALPIPRIEDIADEQDVIRDERRSCTLISSSVKVKEIA